MRTFVGSEWLARLDPLPHGIEGEVRVAGIARGRRALFSARSVSVRRPTDFGERFAIPILRHKNEHGGIVTVKVRDAQGRPISVGSPTFTYEVIAE
jgi:hypothetical protein